MKRLLFSALLALVFQHAEAAKTNVLLICVDDLKPIVGCYGGTAKTPNIDRLAARGVQFQAAYCNQAVCAPSRNALLSGIRPDRMGIYDLGTNFRASKADAVTLPQAFKSGGYRTEAMGKIFHVGHGNHEDPASWSEPHFQAKSIAYALPESRSNAGLTREEALFANQSPESLPRGAAYESADVPDSGYPDGVVAERAIERLKFAKEHPETPFFLAVGFLKPHLPFCAPKKYWDLYDPQAFRLAERRTPPDGAPDFAPTTWGELRQYSEMPQKGPVTDDQARKLIHGYHAATSFADAQIGRVLETLDSTGLAGNTIVVLWGDHGWHLGDHGMWSKHSNYEQAAKIPLIVAGPGVVSGQKANALVESVDLYPTLCEAAGVKAPDGLDGRSFLATLHDVNAPTKDHILHVFPRGERMGRAVRTEGHRLVEWKKPGAPADTAILELYDYQSDPGEAKNLAAENPEVVARLRKMLDSHGEAQTQVREKARGVDRTALFESKDLNHDNMLTHDEFMAGQPDPRQAPARFTRFDADKNGVLSREEFVNSGNVAPPKPAPAK